MTHALTTRAVLTGAQMNDLPDSAFAYIEPGGSKDETGRTVPRSMRHFPIHDADHVRAAITRAPQSSFGDKAMPAIRAAAKKYGIEVHDGRGAAGLLDALLDRARPFEEGNHPRVPAGSSTGGQFGAAKQSKTAGKPAGRPGGHHQGARPMVQVHHDSGIMAYDAASNTGTGYDAKGGDPRVHELQRDLNRLGITDAAGSALKDDGRLGPRTTAAVKKAQRRLGLKPDGVVTPALLAKLNAAKSLPGRSATLDVCVRAFDFEFDARAGGDGRTLEGYAAVFNTRARIRDMQGDFEEVILPGAFGRSLRSRMPILQWDHGKDPRVGTVPIGAIERLAEDSKGLHVRARLFDNQVVEPVRQAIEARAVRGMSFRFGVPDKGDTWTRRAGDVDLREIRDADVHELGPVAFPAYDSTSVTVRSLLAQLDPDEHRSLIHELAAELRLAVDLEDLTGRPGTRSPGGGEPDVEPAGSGEAPPVSTRQRLDDGALRLRRILH